MTAQAKLLSRISCISQLKPIMQNLLSVHIHPSWHFYVAVAGIFCGVVISIAFSLRIFVELYWLILASILLIMAIIFQAKFMLALAFLAGFIIGNFRSLPQLSSQEFFSTNAGQTVLISGLISDDPDFSEGNNVIHLSKICVDNEMCFAGTAYIKLARKIEVERSDYVILQGKLGDGFGTFVTSIFRPTVLNIDKAIPGDLFAKFKAFFSDRIRDYIASPEVDLGLGYLMGMKSGLSDEFSEALRTVGMTHVIVASGAHLGILVGAAKKLFGRLSKFAGLMFSILLIIAFVLTVGFTPSMTRAALVTTLSLMMGYVGRKFRPWRLLILVAALTLLIEPVNFLSLGWQLSFASFFGILILAPRLGRFLYGGKTPPWLAGMLITSFATSLVCAPILIYNFGSISLLSFVANLVILPTLPYVMLLVFLVGATSFLPALAGLLALPATWLLDFHISIVNLLSEKTMFVVNLPATDPRFFLLYLPMAIILLWTQLWGHKHRRKSRIPIIKNEKICYNNEYEN